MWNMQSASPCRELRGYVRAYGQRDFENTSAVAQPSIASLEPTLSLDFCDSTCVEFDNGHKLTAPKISLVGPQTRRRADVLLKGHLKTFGVFFQPFGCWQLFRIPYGLLVDNFYNAEEVLGAGVRRLWERMAECASFEGRVVLVEEFLMQRVAGLSDCTPVMVSALRSFQKHGTVPISALAHDIALSLRQFERSFLRDVGIPPKLFARITRYQRALDAKLIALQRPWLLIAHQFGYFDQMHMIRDFQSLTGVSPSELIRQLVDLRPDALAGALTLDESSAMARTLELY